MQPQRYSQRLSKAKETNTSEKQEEEKKKTRMYSGKLNPYIKICLFDL